MNEVLRILLFMVSCVFTHNFIFSRFLGCCPFLGVSSKVETAVGMGVAVTFVMGLASLFTWLVYNLALVPLKLQYLNTIAFILINCAVLGVAVLNVSEGYNLLYAVLNGIFGALGFLLAIVLMAGVRERLETSDIPAPFRGFPICIVIAGLMSIAFMGFSGIGG